MTDNTIICRLCLSRTSAVCLTQQHAARSIQRLLPRTNSTMIGQFSSMFINAMTVVLFN
jgi:hypothetical protein